MHPLTLCYYVPSPPSHPPPIAIQPKAPSEMSVKELKEAVRIAGLGHLARGFYEKQEYVSLLEAHNSSNTKSW